MTEDMENTCPAKIQRLILIRSPHVTGPKTHMQLARLGSACSYISSSDAGVTPGAKG